MGMTSYVAVHESAVDAVPSQDTERRVNGHKTGEKPPWEIHAVT